MLGCSGLRGEEGRDLRLEGRDGSMLSACQHKPSKVEMLVSGGYTTVNMYGDLEECRKDKLDSNIPLGLD